MDSTGTVYAMRLTSLLVKHLCTPNMVSLEEVKRAVNNESMSDEQAEQIRRDLRAFAELALEIYQQKVKREKGGD